MAKDNNNASAPKDGAKELSTEQKQIVEWLKNVRFKKKLFGGVSELDVWKKIEELNEMYETAMTAAIIAERVRYNDLLKKVQSDKRSSGGEDKPL